MKFNKLIPELSVLNFEKSLNFYTSILGFKIEYKREESKFAMISFQGSQLMIEEINNHWKTGELEKPFGRGVNFQIIVKDIENLFNKIPKTNIFRGVELANYRKDSEIIKQKEFLIQDPDGYLLRFTEEVK